MTLKLSILYLKITARCHHRMAPREIQISPAGPERYRIGTVRWPPQSHWCQGRDQVLNEPRTNLLWCATRPVHPSFFPVWPHHPGYHRLRWKKEKKNLYWSFRYSRCSRTFRTNEQSRPQVQK